MGEVEQRQTGYKRRSRAVAVWLDEGDITRLKEIAREKGIGHTTLIRMWLREKLQELEPGKGG